jgi:hypothetical protein
VDTQPQYASFLIRLWREPAAPGSDWLAQVEFIPTGEQRYFQSLNDLFDFVRQQVTPPAAPTHPVPQESSA